MRPRPARVSRPRRCPGGDLLSHRVAPAVPSALEDLTSGFGMGPGVTPPLWPPKRYEGDRSPRCHALFERSIASVSEPRPRPISTGRLHVLPRFHLRPINPLALRGPYRVNPVG